LLAQIEAPTPLPQTATPRSTWPAASPRQWNYEVRVVVIGDQIVCSEINNLMARRTEPGEQFLL